MSSRCGRRRSAMLLDRVPLRTGTAMLDVGAGTGFLSIELAQRCGLASTVIVADPWASVNARLQRKLAQLGLTNVTVLERDASTLRLRAKRPSISSCQILASTTSTMHARCCASVQAFKPGGHLALTHQHRRSHAGVLRRVPPDTRRTPGCTMRCLPRGAYQPSGDSGR